MGKPLQPDLLLSTTDVFCVYAGYDSMNPGLQIRNLIVEFAIAIAATTVAR
jgi:hypothetical protein